MALQKEIWIASIIEGLFADNTFAARSVDHSSFVDNLTVHVPNAGVLPAVSKTRPFTPGDNITAPAERADVDLTYGIENYYLGPLTIPHAEQVELSYDKRESMLVGVKSALSQAIYADLIYKWLPTGVTTQATTGAATASYIPTATGNRKAVTKKDIRVLRTIFDKWDAPQEDRCLLLDAEMYGQLLSELTETESMAFLASASAQTGVIGNLYGFDIYMRSKVAKTVAAGTPKLWTASAVATDSAAALAWSGTMVSRAVGDVVIYDNRGDAIMFGDVFSGEIRAGGSYMRSDKAGVAILYQATTT
jgi:hypothetical protein